MSCAKTAEPIEMPLLTKTRMDPRKRITWGARWCNLLNTIKPSMCGGRGLSSNYFDHLLLSLLTGPSICRTCCFFHSIASNHCVYPWRMARLSWP